RTGKPFAHFIADWPTEDITGLWHTLKKTGSRLGGNTGPFALRALGVDTFLFTREVLQFLRSTAVIDSGETSQRALRASQDYFNTLRTASGRSLTELSQIIALSVGENRTGQTNVTS
ncbi:MAG: DNA-3-methyladenine glycosylase, partial [Halieaceae bacterium]|nr:DNA-3-methyladenine glycosylase [Halieaceae bacterium]